jgi:hypothetical protein
VSASWRDIIEKKEELEGDTNGWFKIMLAIDAHKEL